MRNHLSPEDSLVLLGEMEDDGGSVLLEVGQLEREVVDSADHEGDLLLMEHDVHVSNETGVVAVLDSIDEIYELLPDLVVHLGSDELVDDVQRPLLARFLYLFDAARPADGAAPLGDQQERDVRGVVDTLQNAREHLAGHAQDLGYSVAVSS